MAADKKSSKWASRFKLLFWGSAGIFFLSLVVVLFWFKTALINHFLEYPREMAFWEDLRKQWQKVPPQSSWKEFRGILHSHSAISHDSEVPFERILAAMESAKLDFICLSDHCRNGRADFDLQWRGVHDGKLFIPGFEMKDGFMPFGVAPHTVLSNQMSGASIAEQTAAHGGILFFAHPEEPRDWRVPQLTGMEIYNIHADLKRQKHPFLLLFPELLLNQRDFPDLVFRRIFQRPVEAVGLWDEMSKTRHLTAIAGNDCHQNTGVRGWFTPAEKILIEETSRKKIAEFQVNRWNRPIAELLFGALKPGQKLFHIELDPYDRMARYVNTHVLASGLDEPAVLDALKAGRAFVGFDMIANATGFQFVATNGITNVVMGESLALTRNARMKAVSPIACRFTIMSGGQPVYREFGSSIQWIPPLPGKYRVEAELRVLGEWVIWVYTNPIEFK
jgi:hypothetical protein